VTLAPGTDVTRALALHEEAHRLCFIANSVNFPVSIEPRVELAA
jgi:organic hydroperoxide reductase OsmC/OhrA